jgi:hypothetical protein
VLIGFAGLGRMGKPMASHLARARHTVLAHDPGLDHAPEGRTVVSSPAELADASLSISMLPDGPTTRELVKELAGAAPGHLHVAMGTVGPELVRARRCRGGGRRPRLARNRRLRLPGSGAAYAVLGDATAAGLGEEDMAQVLAALRLPNGSAATRPPARA